MAALKNAMDIMNLLDKSNCGECGVPACMAFAVSVNNGSKQLGDCPKLDPEILAIEGGICDSHFSVRQVIGSIRLEASADLAVFQKILGR